MLIFYFFYLTIYQIRTHFARPNWKKVFTELANAHQSSRIGIQSCDALCEILKNKKVNKRNEKILSAIFLMQVYSTVEALLLQKH